MLSATNAYMTIVFYGIFIDDIQPFYIYGLLPVL